MNMMVSRRALMGGIALGGAAALMPRAALAWKVDGAGPVSYTHLDVYKRQIGACAPLIVR